MKTKAAGQAAVLFVAAALSGCSKPAAVALQPSTEPGVPVWSLATAPDALWNGGQVGSDSVRFLGTLQGAFLDDDRVVVSIGAYLNQLTNRLLYFDLSGRTVAAAGGRGEGVGELLSIGDLFEVNGGVAVTDRTNLKVAFFSREGSLERETSIRLEYSNVVVGVLDDGSIVTTPTGTPVERGNPRAYHFWSVRGDHIREMQGPIEPGDGHVRLQFAYNDGAFGPQVSELTTSLRDVGCVARIREVVTGDAVLAVNGGTGEVLALRADTPSRTVFKSENPARVTDQMLGAVTANLNEILQRSSQPVAGRRAFTNVAFVPASLDSLMVQFGQPGERLTSVWSDVLRDGGQLWLREATCYSNEPVATWQIVDIASGRLVAFVRVPVGTELLAVRAGKVLAQVTDAGVKRVGLFSVSR